MWLFAAGECLYLLMVGIDSNGAAILGECDLGARCTGIAGILIYRATISLCHICSTDLSEVLLEVVCLLCPVSSTAIREI